MQNRAVGQNPPLGSVPPYGAHVAGPSKLAIST